MSDLISRSELLNAFNNKNVQITFDLPVEEVLGEDVDLDDFAMLVQDAIQAYKKMAIDTIKNQPTAYDIDKIVTELNELDVKSITRYKNGNFGNFDGVEYYIKKRKAIEIVKQGGVDVANNVTAKNDDVCEWKSIGASDNWSTSCDKNSTHNVFGVAWFNRCPYCGRKLKIVGDNDVN